MMRSIVVGVAAVLLAGAVPGWAQTTSPAPAVAAPSTAAPSGATSPSSSAPTKRTHKTLQQRFDAANTTHDGHLTKDQASAAHWSYLARNFDAIDTAHQGFVTPDEIRSYAAQKRAERKAAAATHS